MLVLFGCSGSPSSEGVVTVFAAASLADAFESIGADFEADHPETEVVFNFAGSQTLATQIVEGAGADVFASADIEQMNRVVGEDLVETPLVFAENRLAIVVEATNPHGISGLSDLARTDLTVVLGAPEVPVGAYTNRVLLEAGVEVVAASLEADVRSVLTKVSLGEADAGVVYRSDIVTAGDSVAEVVIPDAFNVTARYPIAVLTGGSETARAFVDYVLSPQGVSHLEAAGLGVPQ